MKNQCPKCKKQIKTEKELERHLKSCHVLVCHQVTGCMEFKLPYDENPISYIPAAPKPSFKPEFKLNSWETIIDERDRNFMEIKVIWEDIEGAQYSSWCMVETHCLKKDLKKAKKLVYAKMKEIVKGLVQDLLEGIDQLKDKVEA